MSTREIRFGCFFYSFFICNIFKRTKLGSKQNATSPGCLIPTARPPSGTMAMREKYTKAGASISYLLADWGPAVAECVVLPTSFSNSSKDRLVPQKGFGLKI